MWQCLHFYVISHACDFGTRVQVALNLDLAGVEDFVTERLGKEVEFITMKNSTQFFCHLKAFLGFLN
jgi:hypothetical protein